MRIQAKQLQAQAIRWSKSDPYSNPYVALDETVYGNRTWLNPNPEVVKIAPQFTQPGQPQQNVQDGDYIVKRPDSEYVEAYTPTEFAKRFTIVEPGYTNFQSTSNKYVGSKLNPRETSKR